MVILDQLKQSRSGDGLREEYIQILAGIPALKRSTVSVLREIASNPEDIASPKAIKALFAIDPNAKLKKGVVEETLERANGNESRAAAFMEAVPHSCSDTPRCVQALAKLAKGGDTRAIEALGRFGNHALPAVPELVGVLYGNHAIFDDGTRKWDPAASAARSLALIDPNCKAVLPIVTPYVADAFKVGKTVQFLNQCPKEAALPLIETAHRNFDL